MKITPKLLLYSMLGTVVLTILSGGVVYVVKYPEYFGSQYENEKSDKEIEETSQNVEPEEEELVIEDVEETEPETPTVEEPVQPVAPSVPAKKWWEYPEAIREVTKDGNDLLVLLNKQYRLPSSYAPTDLVLINESNSSLRVPAGKGAFYLRSIVVGDLKRLGDDAVGAGVDLSIVSAYRSYQTQVSTYNYWVNYNGGSVAAADMISARPGHSQHQLGTTLDFSSSEINDALGAQFNTTRAAAWLLANGWRYGFVIAYPQSGEEVTGYAHESWHYRYIGVENALEWKESGMLLESWLQSKSGL